MVLLQQTRTNPRLQRGTIKMFGLPMMHISRPDYSPPDMVTFADALDHIRDAPESAPLIGYDWKLRNVCADYDAESPHVLISAGSGGGKSALVRGLLTQGLHHGGIGIVLDPKRISQAWARGLPNVLYCRTTEEIHFMLLALQDEVGRRNERADDLADPDGDIPAAAYPQIGPRLIVAAEEMNATASRLNTYWKQVKEKNDPAVSPAVVAMNEILFMGRQVRVNVIAVAQMMSARALGGPEGRENFATRILTRYTVNAWRMLAPEVWPAPKSSRHPGRIQVVNAGRAAPTQAVWWTPKEARQWAQSGTVALVAGHPLAIAGQPHVLAVPAVPAPLPLGETAGTVPAPPPRVTLSEACSQGVVGLSLEAVRKARQRDPEFPKSQTRADGAFDYDRAELEAWARARAALVFAVALTEFQGEHPLDLRQPIRHRPHVTLDPAPPGPGDEHAGADGYDHADPGDDDLQGGLAHTLSPPSPVRLTAVPTDWRGCTQPT